VSSGIWITYMTSTHKMKRPYTLFTAIAITVPRIPVSSILILSTHVSSR
jgi:hypothetical protein